MSVKHRVRKSLKRHHQAIKTQVKASLTAKGKRRSHKPAFSNMMFGMGTMIAGLAMVVSGLTIGTIFGVLLMILGLLVAVFGGLIAAA